MDFVIQVCNPLILHRQDERFEELSEAMQAIFPMDTEDAFLLWNGIPVKISYKYDLSVLIDDLLPLLSSLMSSDKGSYRVYWSSDTFMAEWLLAWDGGQLTVTTKWDSVAGSYEDLLNSRSKLEVALSKFLSEWKTLLSKIIEAVDEAGVYLTEEQENLALLRSIEASIPAFGCLYGK